MARNRLQSLSIQWFRALDAETGAGNRLSPATPQALCPAPFGLLRRVLLPVAFRAVSKAMSRAARTLTVAATGQGMVRGTVQDPVRGTGRGIGRVIPGVTGPVIPRVFPRVICRGTGVAMFP